MPDIENPRKATLVNADGSREEFRLGHEQVLEFARIAATEFGVGESRSVKFDSDLAKRDIAGDGDVKATRKRTAKTAAAAGAKPSNS